jgi:hypothetical protein
MEDSVQEVLGSNLCRDTSYSVVFPSLSRQIHLHVDQTTIASF